MSTYRQSFESYINGFYSKKGEGFTHTRIGDNQLNIKGGVYSIDNENEEKFYEKYRKHLFKDRKQEFLTEKQHLEAGPLCVDFDFRYESEIEDRQHTEDHITDMVNSYITNLDNIYDIPEGTKIPVYIMEKDDVNTSLENVTKDGIHMIFGIHTERGVHIMLRNKMIRELSDMWDDLPLINTWEEVLDEGIVNGTTNWQLYGSRKPGNSAYMLKYNYLLSKGDEDTWYCEKIPVTKFDWENKFVHLTVRYKGHQKFTIRDDVRSEYDMIVQSMKNKSSGTKSKGKMRMANRDNHINVSEITCQDELDAAVEHFVEELETKDYEIKETHQYTMCLSENYYNPYDKWIRVGWALKNTGDSLFLTWVLFSSRSSKFSFGDIPDMYERWCRFEVNVEGLTKRSILYWAKNDNPTEYNKIRDETIDYYVEKTLPDGLDFDIACVLYQSFKGKFVCVSIKKDIWYEYHNHKWRENESGTSLRMIISTYLYGIYAKKQEEIMGILPTLDTGCEKYNTLAKRCTALSDICKKVKLRSNKDNFMREAKELFYDKDFDENIDANTRLLCCNNGVLDFNTKTFRKGQPDDFISKSTNIDYYPITDRDAVTVSEINDFMEKLYPEEELRNYMWDHLASTLIGENNDQTFNIYNGCGSNGKSKLVELMSLALGEYKETVPITLITQKRNSVGSTSSEVVALKGARYAVMQEPSKGDKLNEGIMKEITGGDPLQGRALFKDCVTFIPQFKLVVCTNNLLDIGSNDEGTWRRIMVVEFKSKFTENPVHDDPIIKYQFPIDKKLGEKFKKWAPVFLSMLVNKAHQTDGLVKACSIVQASSGNYRNTQDYFSDFVNDKVKLSKGDKIKETSLYETFKGWYQLHHGKNIPKGRDLFDYMNKRFGKKVRGVWENVSIIYNDYDPDLDMEEED